MPNVEDTLRCHYTTNPCGTDTWQAGTPCVCQACQAWLRILELKQQMVDALAKIYRLGHDETCSLAVADLCDEELDKSGKLLGEVRKRALELDES